MKTNIKELEQKMKDLEMPKFLQQKTESISENAKRIVNDRINLTHRDLITTMERHLREINTLEKQIDNWMNLKQMLIKGGGYVRMNQFTVAHNFIRSDFTTVEELVSLGSAVEYLTYQPTARLSDYVFSVASNGLLTLVDSKVDSSD